MRSTGASRKSHTAQEQDKGTSHENPEVSKGKETILEHFHTLINLGNTLSWGDQPIPDSMDEVVDVQSIAYDRKIQLVVKRMEKRGE
jgi:hypothetical protein